jgi:GntR family transcriptional regulator
MTTSRRAAAAAPAFFNPYPKYLQVRQALARRLATQYAVGDQIPTEQALQREYGVSRETVREALRGLEDEGLLQRAPGRGTFLLRKPDAPAGERLTGLVEDFSALHLDTRAHLLESGRVRLALGTGASREAWRIRRLRRFERQPLAVHEAELPLALGERIAGEDLERTSIIEVLGRLGVPHVEEHQRIEATLADADLARLLEVGIGAPILLVTRELRLVRPSGSIVFRSWYRADRYYYTYTRAPAPPRKRAAAPKPAPRRR